MLRSLTLPKLFFFVSDLNNFFLFTFIAQPHHWIIFSLGFSNNLRAVSIFELPYFTGKIHFLIKLIAMVLIKHPFVKYTLIFFFCQRFPYANFNFKWVCWCYVYFEHLLFNSFFLFLWKKVLWFIYFKLQRSDLIVKMCNLW